MKKLNNKGMTTMEILVSFILIAIIASSLYVTVSNFNTKRRIESEKLEINTYKNLLTKEIQDDIIKTGIIDVATKESKENDKMDVYIVDITLKDYTKRRIVIKRQLADDFFLEVNASTGQLVEPLRNYDDEFHIYYGTPTNSTNYIDQLEEFTLPDFGYSYNHTSGVPAGTTKYKVKDLRIENVKISKENSTFSLFIGFHHPDLGSKYAINIVAPINYET